MSDYRRSGRGGRGVTNRNQRAEWPSYGFITVVEEDQLMLVTNMGQVIRIRVHGAEGDSFVLLAVKHKA